VRPVSEDEVDQLAAHAARIIAPVFEDEDWRWGVTDEVPDQVDIARHIRRLLGDVLDHVAQRDQIITSSGGFVVDVFSGAARVMLNLGQIDLIRDEVEGEDS
jgi:hypothetical protein